MFIARFLLDVVICVWLLAAIPKLLTTGIDVVKKLANGTNKTIRKAFKLDEEEKKKSRYSFESDDD